MCQIGRHQILIGKSESTMAFDYKDLDLLLSHLVYIPLPYKVSNKLTISCRVNCHSLLLGTPVVVVLDLLSTTRESFLTSSFGISRGRLNQCPPSTTTVVPLMYLPSYK